MSVRVVSPLDAIAWLRLVEMRGSVQWCPRAERWLCAAPNGEPGEYVDCEGQLYEFGDTPGEAVALVYLAWVELGRPPWPAEIEVTCDEHPDRDRDERPDEHEPFCACGHVVSECDESRIGCADRRRAAKEVLDAR